MISGPLWCQFAQRDWSALHWSWPYSGHGITIDHRPSPAAPSSGDPLLMHIRVGKLLAEKCVIVRFAFRCLRAKSARRLLLHDMASHYSGQCSFRNVCWQKTFNFPPVSPPLREVRVSVSVGPCNKVSRCRGFFSALFRMALVSSRLPLLDFWSPPASENFDKWNLLWVLCVSTMMGAVEKKLR